MPYVHGLPACTCLVEWVPAFERAIGRAPRLFQLAGDAPASNGFHRNGGSADYEPLSEAELRTARNMGGAAWNRWWYDDDGGSNFHSHIRLNGCPHNTVGQPQVEDLNEGRDGTGPLYDNAGAPDDGPRDGVRWPLRTWREGIEWAEQQEDDMAFTDWPEKDQNALVNAVADKVVDRLLAADVDPGKPKLSVRQALRQGANAPGVIRDAAKALAAEINKAAIEGTRGRAPR